MRPLRRRVGCGRRGAYRRHGIDPIVIRNFVPQPPADVPGWAERGGAPTWAPGRAKGVRDVVELARVAPDVPVDIVGFGELGDELARTAQEVPNLTYHGRVPREETVRRLLAARVALMPSRAPEGGPLVALQAMALGTPVVAYDAGGLGEYVRRGGGDVVEPGAGPLAAAVRTLLGDEGAWQMKSAHGRRTVERSTPRPPMWRVWSGSTPPSPDGQNPDHQQSLTNHSSNAVLCGYDVPLVPFRLVFSRTPQRGREEGTADRTSEAAGRHCFER